MSGSPKEPLNQGATNDDAAAVIRKNLIPAFRDKPGWEAVIEAMAAGDAIINDNNFKAFDQLFLSSASGVYLQRKANDVGVIEPNNVGMGDDIFRKLAIKFTAKKLVVEALLEILEVFYGQDATRANLSSGKAEPYTLADGQSISFLIDDRKSVIATFSAADFSAIGQATAPEVAALISRAFRSAGVDAYATYYFDEDGKRRVKIYSGALGLLGSLTVTGGIAQNALLFPSSIPILHNTPTNVIEWTVSKTSTGVYRFTYAGYVGAQQDVPELLSVLVGDYVNLQLPNNANLNGSFPVTQVHVDVDPTTGSYINLSWFEIQSSNDLGILGPIVVQSSVIAEMLFFRPNRFTVTSLPLPSFVAQYQNTGMEILLPATTQAVNRTANSAAYLHVAPSLAISTATRFLGLVTVVTAGNHGLSTGQVVALEGVAGVTAGRWNLLGTIIVLSPTSFTLSDAYTKDGSGAGGFVIPLASPATDGIPGPYLLDPDDGVGVTAIHSTSSQAIAKGRGIATLSVTDASTFPNTHGHLVIGFGTEYESAPVPYFGVLDSNNLILDRNYAFTHNIPSGADVTLLAIKGPWVPDHPEDIGSFYLTASPAGRVAAESFLDETIAAGVSARKTIVYPGDRGLGGEGLSVSGQKISDRVAVWSGDDTDGEVGTAHG